MGSQRAGVGSLAGLLPYPMGGWVLSRVACACAGHRPLVPGLRWGQVRELLDEKLRLREERGPGEGLERREEGEVPGVPGPRCPLMTA